jgi:molybdenum cofactor cytidylyltransferase
LGTSVAAGAAATGPKARGILYINGDQPLVPTSLIDQLADAALHSEAMIIQHRAKCPPVIFHRALRGELCQLAGDVGGRQLMQTYRRQTLVIPNDPGPAVMDVDTEEDYEKLQKIWLRNHTPTPDRG